MYVRPYHQETDPGVILDFIRQYPFATLVSQGAGYPQASHIPLELIEGPSGSLQLMGHLANANPQLITLRDFPTVLAIFLGPNSYISAGWYPVPEVASTWNYLAVHALGKITLVDPATTLEHLKRLTHRHEKNREKPMSVDRMGEEYLQKNLSAITGFRIEVEELENTYKLSQNKDAKTRLQIITELKQSGEPGALKIALEMARRTTIPEPEK
ncbi:MAG TPA: FMN-binding negative transcriptional regulator [Chitinophagaceae bacterium]|nr:FMN-binding negative transcriptional regulator [Chitinophagaceae bacterium]